MVRVYTIWGIILMLIYAYLYATILSSMHVDAIIYCVLRFALSIEVVIDSMWCVYILYGGSY